MKKNDAQNDAVWEPCPSGRIQTVIDRTGPTLRQPSTGSEGGLDRRAAMKIAAGVAVVAGAGVLTYRFRKPAKPVSNGMVFAGISCREVLDELPEYVNRSIDDPELVVKIDEHLELCSHCQEKYEQTKETSNA